MRFQPVIAQERNHANTHTSITFSGAKDVLDYLKQTLIERILRHYGLWKESLPDYVCLGLRRPKQCRRVEEFGLRGTPISSIHSTRYASKEAKGL